jgi:lambda family phage portal protein
MNIPWSFKDRLLALVSPRAAAAQVDARAKGAAMEMFKGASTTRRSMRSFNPLPRDPNEELSPELRVLRGRSRYLAANVPLATGAISTVITSVVGDGLVLKSKLDRKLLGLSEDQATEKQNQIERQWQLFCKHCDFGERQNFDGLLALAFRSVLESGDLGVARRRDDASGKPYALRVQLIEADRIANPAGKPNTPTLVDGVELDAEGRPRAVHITERFPYGGYAASRKTKRYAMYGSATGMPLIFLLGDQLRPGQVRGSPYLAPVVESLKQLGDYADAEMQAAVVAAMLTVFIEQETPDDADPVIGDNTAEGINPENEIALGSGAVVGLAPGEKANVANPGRPNASFEAFVSAVSREIGVALQLPQEVLLKHFQSSYSAARASLEMAWQFFRMRRSWLAWNFCQPIFEWFMTEAVAKGRISAPGFFSEAEIREGWLGSVWVGPSRIQLDPQKEAVADQLDLAMGVTNRETIILERKGGSFEATHEQLVREQRRRDQDGLVTPVANTGFANADTGNQNQNGA